MHQDVSELVDMLLPEAPPKAKAEATEALEGYVERTIGEAIESYDPTDAIEEFLSGGNRRRTRGGSSPLSEAVEEALESALPENLDDWAEELDEVKERANDCPTYDEAEAQMEKLLDERPNPLAGLTFGQRLRWLLTGKI